ncbi:MAG: GAF domain-containing protein, partial [Leptospiraceae bacterium]|nr:GAF domain-containing protein [Leptospiraceae bacterium]
ALNELSDLEDIMQAIFLYILGKFHFPYYTITLLDPQHNLLKHAHSYLPENLSEKDVNLLKSITLSLDSSNTKSLHMKAIMDRKPFYVLDAESVIKTERGKYILSVLNHKSFVILPIILQNQPIGTLELFSQDFVSLYEDDLIELSFLSEQLAGIIKRSLLMSQIQEEKEKAIVAQIEIEMQKKETEDLNNLIKSLNEELDLKVIMQKVLDYLKTNFNIQYFALYNLDKEKTQLTMMDGNFPTHMSKEDRTKVLNFKISIQNVKGVHAFPFKAKKPFFVPRIRETGGTEEENIISKLYKISSIIILPLILNHEIIGTVDLSSEKKMKLSKADITKLSILGEQLAGIIHGSNLLKLVQEEKEKALMLKIEADVQKQETEQLNNLIKSLNEDLNINTIMQKVHTFIKMNYDINYYGLAVVDKSKEFLVTVDTFSPEFISSADKERISKFSTRVKDVVGAHALAFKSKKPFYASRIRKSGMTQEELFNQETTKLESILIIPLILQNEPIGFLDLYNAGKMELSKEDIIKLSILGEQLAGIIYGSNLLKEVQEEKEKANLAKEEADKARQETEGLNELMRNVNSVSSLIDIMSFIMYYLETEYNFNDFYLLLNEESEKKLVPFSFTSTRHKEHEKQYFLETRIDHSDLQGVFERIFETKRAVFVEKENIPEDDRIAKEWIEKGDFDYLFLLPLVIYDELIGILFVHSPSTAMFPSKEIRLKIERFSDLIAGSVFNAKLLKKVEEAKEIAVKAQIEAGIERDKSEKLLLNILPKDVASELKEKGFAEPELFESVSVMFTDFKGFTQIAETLTPQELIKDLDACFVQFDKISERFNLEKLKTIGDSYMCAGGIPKRNTTHAIDCCLAALEIQSFMNMMKKLKEDMGFPYWELRLGIHSGSLVAGVIGEKKFAYDVWGDTVNTASRMESSGTPGKINISYSTYELVKHLFDCEYRGKVSAKNKGVVKMYYLNRIKPEYSKDEEGLIPNGKFWSFY